MTSEIAPADSKPKLGGSANSGGLESIEMDSTPVPKRHWASMRLFYLFLALTAACTVFGLWLGPAYQQAAIIDRIESIGGRVYCQENANYPQLGPTSDWIRKSLSPKYFDLAHTVTILDVKTETNDIFKSIAGLSRTRRLCLNGCNVDDESVKAISRLKYLKRLDLESTNITDRSLDYLADHPSLELINITNTAVSRKAIEKLNRNSKIKIGNVVDYEVEFFDEANRKTSLPLKVGTSYTVGVKAEISNNCLDANTTFLHLYFDVPTRKNRTKASLRFGAVFDPLSNTKLKAGTLSPDSLWNGSFKNTFNLGITRPCTIKIDVYRTNSSRQCVIWKTIEVPFSN